MSSHKIKSAAPARCTAWMDESGRRIGVQQKWWVVEVIAGTQRIELYMAADEGLADIEARHAARMWNLPAVVVEVVERRRDTLTYAPDSSIDEAHRDDEAKPST